MLHRPLPAGRVLAVTVLLALGALGLVACSVSTTAPSSSSPDSTTPPGSPIAGGTAYFAEQPETPPNYIFPLISGENFTVANTADLQTLLYEPLYWFGDRGSTSIDYPLSIGNPPVYSDHNRVVTITLKHYLWSDGEVVSARDVLFWIYLLKANADEWASYVPGGFPDNVTSATALGPTTVRLRLNASYNPVWYTYNELSQITPLPIAWDRTSMSAPVPSAGAKDLPDTTSRGAEAVYNFLNDQAKDIAGYASSRIWSIVDGAWKLVSLTTDGTATFVPNRSFSGPNKPHLAEFVELPFTSAAAEFSVLRAGSSTGGSGSASSDEISVGYVPDNDLPQSAALRAQGYQLVDWYPFQFDYFEPNFNNPTVGPILRQLYFRQAFQHLVDQLGWIHAYYGDLGLPTYGPIPASPPNPYADANASVDPYPFSISAARSLLVEHGWKVVPNGVSVCSRPGTGPDQCGPDIKAGEALNFTLMYPSGLPYTDGSMVDLQSVAKQVGIEISLKEVTATTIASTIDSCSPSQASCSWELGQYGAGWVFEPDHYPSGEEIFETGALGNVSNYSNTTSDKLIVATTETSSADAQAALDAYQNQVRLELPDFWQPSPGTLVSLSSNLHGFEPNAYGFISPEEWYFTKG
ncbi:MAG TPA: ABC transporter substrate-binding protein [Acidimicrobiales bacterium]|nr:ABC transporter substrate-binding protein [Acidimicrobiales bacterium]